MNTWWKFYLFRFFDDFILIYPVYALMFQDNGLSTVHISTLLVIWSVTTVILEVPSGIVADKFSRKKILVIAQLIRALGYVFWLIGGSYFAYAAGFILWGVKSALMSGTFDALVYDEMKAARQESRYELVNGRIKTSGFIGVSLALLLGGYLAEYGYVLPLVLSILATVISALVVITFKNVPNASSTKEEKYLTFLKNALSEAGNNKKLLGIIILISMAFGAYGAADELFALLFREYGLSLSLVGVASSFKFIAFAIAGVTAGYIGNSIKDVEKHIMLVAAGLFTLVAILNTPWALVLIFIASYIFGVSEIKLEAQLQKQIESHRRATLLSFKSILLELIVILMTLLMGVSSKYFGIVSILYILSVFIIIGYTTSMLIKVKTDK